MNQILMSETCSEIVCKFLSNSTKELVIKSKKNHSECNSLQGESTKVINTMSIPNAIIFLFNVA